MYNKPLFRYISNRSLAQALGVASLLLLVVCLLWNELGKYNAPPGSQPADDSIQQRMPSPKETAPGTADATTNPYPNYLVPIPVGEQTPRPTEYWVSRSEKLVGTFIIDWTGQVVEVIDYHSLMSGPALHLTVLRPRIFTEISNVYVALSDGQRMLYKPADTLGFSGYVQQVKCDSASCTMVLTEGTLTTITSTP